MTNKLTNLRELAEKVNNGKFRVAELTELRDWSGPETILKLIKAIELQQKVLDNYHHSVFNKDRMLLRECDLILEDL